MSHRRYIDTLWETWGYDVWGNQWQGFEINNRFNLSRAYPLRLKVVTYNAGTPQAFDSAAPTHRQIKRALGIKARARIATDGDDEVIYVEHESSGFPLGEMRLVEPASGLSPIKWDQLKPGRLAKAIREAPRY